MDEMIVRVEHNNPNIAESLALRLRDVISMRPVIEIVPPGSLDRFEGKANRVIDTRPKDD
jgi:phenylacetate-coenzyme A ligase PaaK-like adenylate-forming protein